MRSANRIGPLTLHRFARHDFRYPSKFVDVLGSRLHCIDVGKGDPIVLVHGQPAWSYLWRNVIPHLERSGRVIAVDLVGFGRSDRPDIAYSLEDHLRYFDGFIQALGLERLTLVGHDWGSFLAFQYARRHADNTAALVFMEAILPPDFLRPDSALPLFDRAFAFWDAARIVSSPADSARARQMVERDNIWIEEILPKNVLRTLSADEHDAYRAPFRDAADRLPMLQFPRCLRSRFGLDEVLRYSEWLKQSNIPKLVFAVGPA